MVEKYYIYFDKQALKCLANITLRFFEIEEIQDVFNEAEISYILGSVNLEDDIKEKIQDKVEEEIISCYLGSVNFEKDIYIVYQNIQSSSIDDGFNKLIEILENFCHPLRFFKDGFAYHNLVREINGVLKFYNFYVNEENGKISPFKTSEEPSKLDKLEYHNLFDSRDFHTEIVKHAQILFNKGNYFHAIFECCKAYDIYVQNKTKRDDLSGSDLMANALKLNGILWLNEQKTDTEKSMQEGIMHLSIGLMKAIRNVVSHQTLTDWPINEKDALEILSLISFLFHQIDKTYFKS